MMSISIQDRINKLQARHDAHVARLDQLAKLKLETLELVVQEDGKRRGLKLAPLGLSNTTDRTTGREYLIAYHPRGKAIVALRSDGTRDPEYEADHLWEDEGVLGWIDDGEPQMAHKDPYILEVWKPVS
jgi:hypothetical protein